MWLEAFKVWHSLAFRPCGLGIGLRAPPPHSVRGEPATTSLYLISVGGSEKFMWVGIYCGPHRFCDTCLGYLLVLHLSKSL